MLGVVGTVPQADFPLTAGQVRFSGGKLCLAGRTVEVTRGTGALLAAACTALAALKQPLPVGFLAGDTGLGEGSQRLYDHVARQVGGLGLRALAFHYILPVVDWHYRVWFALEKLHPRPLLIADAGFMYVAKMSGLAPHYDLFTPDAGELAFLADEEAPHPFYTRGFLLQEEEQVPDLIERAYAHDNAARFLLVKGRIDYVASREGILAAVTEPQVPTLEPIGGTGDTLTGIAAALISTGMEVPEAARLAAHVNRLAGALACLTPASSVAEIIAHLPTALRQCRPLFHEPRTPFFPSSSQG